MRRAKDTGNYLSLDAESAAARTRELTGCANAIAEELNSYMDHSYGQGGARCAMSAPQRPAKEVRL